MSFLEELKAFCVSEGKRELKERTIVTNVVVFLDPLNDLVGRLLADLHFDEETGFTQEQEELYLNCFSYVLHKGIAAAVAAKYRRTNIDFTYSFEDAKSGKTPSFSTTLLPVPGEYFFNLRYHLSQWGQHFNDIFYSVCDFIYENEEKMAEEQVTVRDVFGELLFFAGLIGIEFVKRIDITVEDYFAIKYQIVINDAALVGDSDLMFPDKEGEFDEPVKETVENYTVHCSFCGEKALDVSKTAGDVWGEAQFDPCEHFSFGFISNINNHVYGKEFYKRSFRRALIDYVETYKGYTCENSYEEFLNELYNGEIEDFQLVELETVLDIMKTNIPDCKIATKYFIADIEGSKHAVCIHFSKFLTSALEQH